MAEIDTGVDTQPSEPSEPTQPPATGWTRGRRVAAVAGLALLGLVVGAAGATATRPDPAVTLVESGYSKVTVVSDLSVHDGEHVLTYGAVVGNLRDEAALETFLNIEILDADGKVIDETGDSIPVLLPGETAGVGGFVDNPDAADLRFSVGRTSSWREADGLGRLKVADVALDYNHDGTPLATFQVTSTYRRKVPELPSYDLVFRDTRGRIVGGRSGFIINAGKLSPKAPVDSSGRADFRLPHLARVDVYAQVPNDFVPED